MRKKPQQARSRQLVASLIEATGQCIAAHGLDNTTTPLIAERAGVSVGSLYQYFDSKEALLDALAEKLARDVGLALVKLPIPDTATLHERVSLAIRFGFGVMHSENGLYLELMRNWHRLPTDRVVDVLQQYFYDSAQLYFLKHYREYPVQELQARVFIVINSTAFTLVRFFSQDNPLLGEEAVQAGLIEMITGFLSAKNQT